MGDTHKSEEGAVVVVYVLPYDEGQRRGIHIKAKKGGGGGCSGSCLCFPTMRDRDGGYT